jgi:GNAT superfamily N-acetyltransferase
MSTDATINYKVIGYFDLYPNKMKGPTKKTKSKYFRKMRELYERGFKLYDFKKSTTFRDDSAVLIYKDDRLLGYAFIKIETSDVTHGISDPFFYNFVIDPQYQGYGYGSKLLEHIKKLYPVRALYCLTDKTDTTLHEWYDRRGGIVYNDYEITWPTGYFAYKFPNGTVHVEKVQVFTKEDEIRRLKEDAANLTIVPDLDPTVGDDLMGELDDICGSADDEPETKNPGIFNLVAHHPMDDHLVDTEYVDYTPTPQDLEDIKITDKKPTSVFDLVTADGASDKALMRAQVLNRKSHFEMMRSSGEEMD